jgi:mannose/fructose/N-acetylgalactosamine-specific phosphotransferase system component IIC
VTANSLIFLTVNTTGGTVGSPYVSARVASTSFTITSTSGTDTSTVAWMLFEP